MADVIDRLETQFAADLNDFQASMSRMVKLGEDACNKVVAKHKHSQEGIAALWGKSDIGEALNKTFSSARLGVLEEGGAKIGIFGGALEALGPAGLTAAAGLAAVGGALELAKSAAEYSEEISNAADKLGITTKALQEYNFVAVASGVSTDAMKEALQSGNKVLGDFQTNMASGKSKKFFEALGITQEDAAQAKNITDLLPEIAEKMHGLSAAEQEAIAKRGGLEGILPVLQKGPEAIRDLQTEAEKSGAVLDTELIAKGKEAAEAMKEASLAVSVNLHRAFVDLAPVIEACMRLISDMARDLADAVELFRGIQGMSRTGVQDAQSETQKAMGNWGTAAQWTGSRMNQKTGRMEGGLLGGVYNYFAGQKDRENDRLKVLDGQDAAAEAKTHAGTSGQLVADKPKKEKKAPEDQTGQFDTSSQEAMDSAKKEVADAYKSLARDLTAKGELEKQSVDDETDKKIAALKKQEADILKSKNDAHSAEQIATIKAAIAQTSQAAELKKTLIDQQTADALLKQNIEDQQKINSMLSNIEDMRASMAPTAAERNSIQMKNLLDNQQRARLDQDAQWKKDTEQNNYLRDNNLPGYDGGLDSKIANQRDVMQRQQSTQVQQLQYQQRNPVEQWSDSLKDVQTQLQQIEVKGLQGLTDGITDAIMHTKSLGAAFHEIAQSIISDLVKIGVEQMITRPLAGALFGSQGTNIASAASPTSGLLGSLFGSFGHMFGFATGTDSAPGGLAMVGEKGPEMVALPGGSQVLPNNLLRNAMSSPAGGGVQQTSYNLTTVVNADQSVLTGHIQGWIAAAHQSAVATATQAATQQQAMARRNTLIR